jgi:hypothetical protein
MSLGLHCIDADSVRSRLELKFWSLLQMVLCRLLFTLVVIATVLVHTEALSERPKRRSLRPVRIVSPEEGDYWICTQLALLFDSDRVFPL